MKLTIACGSRSLSPGWAAGLTFINEVTGEAI
jgi:hypothetical protein